MLKGKELMIMRIRTGLKGQDIARMIGVTQSYVSKMENEHKPIPDELYKTWIRVLKKEGVKS